MRVHGFRASMATLLATAVLAGSAWMTAPALAAGPSGASVTGSQSHGQSRSPLGEGTTRSNAGGGQDASGVAGTSTHPAASGGQGTAGTRHSGGSSRLTLGLGVAAAVKAALSSGTTGSALANAIHEVIQSEKHNARGLSVAMAVYQDLTTHGAGGAGSGATGSSVSSFKDLSKVPWASAAITALNRAGVIHGTAADKFSPGQPVTLAELVVMLDHLDAGSSTSATVPAGTPAWARGAMSWALGTGVLSGVRGLGGPDAPLTRAQAVLMILNAAGLGRLASTLDRGAVALSGQVPAWARGALALAVKLGVLKGSDGNLLATAPLTRAEVAVLLARLSVLLAASAGGTATG